MATWCLTKQAEKDLLEALEKDGNPQKMVDRGPKGRIAWFTKFVGKENASELNVLFESSCKVTCVSKFRHALIC